MKQCKAGSFGLKAPLTTIEVRVFTARFLEDRTLDETALKVHRSREQVRQIELRAAAKVRRILCAKQFRAAP